MESAFTFLGGLGLFLLGMTLMTDGLKLSAGQLLGKLLEHATRTRLKALCSGFLITTLVQSSSAVTVAIIGLINAGVLSFRQALWVIFGTNVGTTMTGWIVALVGFKFRIETFALPMIGAGVLLYLTGSQTRRAGLGHAIAGFGLLFLGLSFLQEAFAGQAQTLQLPTGVGLSAVLMQVLIGILMTILMQSSSAALAITLTAASGGMLTIEGAAAMIIGLNVGTTVTALLAAINATSNGKRAAMAHLAFNLVTALAALLMLPWLLTVLLQMQHLLLDAPGMATTLALFHTTFNLLGVMLMWPISDRLANWLLARFHSHDDDLARPRFIDDNIATVTSLAIPAAELEIHRLGRHVVRAWLDTLDAEHLPASGSSRGSAACLALSQQIASFLIRTSRQSQSAADADSLARLLQIKRRYDGMTGLLATMSDFQPGQAGESALLETARRLLQRSQPGQDERPPLPEEVREFDVLYAARRLALMMQAARGEVDVLAMEDLLNHLSALHQAVLKAADAISLMRADEGEASSLTMPVAAEDAAR